MTVRYAFHCCRQSLQDCAKLPLTLSGAGGGKFGGRYGSGVGGRRRRRGVVASPDEPACDEGASGVACNPDIGIERA